ncbi:MAG TPA: hypothetical protein VGI10_28535 [Polyangiaceae bacterium]|jgi:hypothetical protein
MTELEPLIEGCDEFERALLRSTQRDVPPPGGLPKTLSALGLGAGAFATATQAGAASAAALSAGSLSVWTVLKAVAVGALAGTVVSVAAGGLTREPPRVQSGAPMLSVARQAATAALVPARTVTATPDATPEAIPEAIPANETAALANANGAASTQHAQLQPDAQPAAPLKDDVAPALPTALPSSTPVAAFALAPSTEPAPDAPSVASIAEEVKTIDRARQALAAGRASDALSQANTYIARWPSGALAIEAQILRVEAELATGDRASAERDARALIAAHPGSRYASRVGALFSPPLSE